MSSTVIGRGSLSRLAGLGNAAELEPLTRTEVYGVDPDAKRSGWVLMADPIHDRPRDNQNAIADFIEAN